MLETRIRSTEIRSLRASGIEIRKEENSIFILGSLPIRSLSSPITDRATGKKFKEMIEPLAFKLKLMENKVKGNRTKLLKNHSYDHELQYDELEFDEVGNELRFEFSLPKTERNLELLEDISDDNASFSFGFLCGAERKKPTNEAGIDYIRVIDSFKELREISILDVFTNGAYDKAKGFKAGAVAEAEKKVEKFVERKNREKQIASDEQKLQELKQYIVKQKNNELMKQIAGLR